MLPDAARPENPGVGSTGMTATGMVLEGGVSIASVIAFRSNLMDFPASLAMHLKHELRNISKLCSSFFFTEFYRQKKNLRNLQIWVQQL